LTKGRGRKRLIDVVTLSHAANQPGACTLIVISRGGEARKLNNAGAGTALAHDVSQGSVALAEIARLVSGTELLRSPLQANATDIRRVLELAGCRGSSPTNSYAT